MGFKTKKKKKKNFSTIHEDFFVCQNAYFQLGLKKNQSPSRDFTFVIKKKKIKNAKINRNSTLIGIVIVAARKTCEICRYMQITP